MSPLLLTTISPWPEPAGKQRTAIELAAQRVFVARGPRLAVGARLADLYDPRSMPAELMAAHEALNREKLGSGERWRGGPLGENAKAIRLCPEPLLLAQIVRASSCFGELDWRQCSGVTCPAFRFD